MKISFIKAQETLYRQAADLLALYECKAKDMIRTERRGLHFTAQSLDKQLTKISEEFEAVRAKLLHEENVINHSGIIVQREDCVTVAECFNY